ncbi:MAG: hypothetical protein HGA45_08050, partial [Chloroflexales bacterium]|nr:hypothetical protein [Chloroflexales bacterium]
MNAEIDTPGMAEERQPEGGGRGLRQRAAGMPRHAAHGYGGPAPALPAPILDACRLLRA